MHSITGSGYFLAILVAHVFSSDYHLLSEPNVTLSYLPFIFYYKTNDFLMMEIVLKNISPSVTAVHLIYLYEQYTYWYKKPEVKVIENPTSEVKFMILKHLKYKYIAVEVELHSQSKVCETTNIAEGRDETTLTPYRDNILVYNNQYSKLYYEAVYCVAPVPCKIVVDLKNICQEQVSCNREKSQYICTITKQLNTMTFYQTYGDGSYIGPALKMEMDGSTETKLIIKLELFDNNSLVKIATTKNEIILYKKELSFTAEEINSEDYGSVRKLRYSESTDVVYSCHERLDYVTKYMVHVGIINKTYKKITTHNTTLIRRKFKMADNGSILCCLYYVFRTDWTSGKKVYLISRIVTNKYLLFYNSQESQQPTTTTQKSRTKQHNNNNCQCNNSTVSESKEQTKARLLDWLIYLVPMFLGMSVLMLALYFIKKQKHCCTNSQPVEETVELDNLATQNQVLYADLDLVRDGHVPESRSEESHYANIIGTLHPLRQ